MLASNESPYPPLPEVVEAITRALGGAQPLPGPDQLRAAPRGSRTATASRRRASRSATAPATSCSPPARRCSSPAPSSSTRGRRSRSTRTWPPRRARARSRSRSTPSTGTTSTAMRQEITAATRLVIVCNPNNPTSTALPLDEIAAFVGRRPAPRRVILDEAYCEFNLLDDPDASLELLDRHPNLVLLRTFSKVYGLCGLRVGYALCGSEELPHGGRPGPPAVLLQRRRAGRRRRGAAPPGRGRRAASSATSPSGWASRTACASSGIEPAESQANFVWFDLRRGRRRARGRARARRARRARARRNAARPRGRAARDVRHRGGEPALPRGPRRAALGDPQRVG